LRRTLRSLQLDNPLKRLERRHRSALVFAEQLSSLPESLLDTTVYIDTLQNRLPLHLSEVLRTSKVWHSTVTECEMAVLLGILDPSHPGTARAIEEVSVLLEGRSEERILSPDRQTWFEAGVLAGTLARLQQYGKAEQRRALNDALIFVSATRAGLTVLTRNIVDYDLMMQITGRTNVIFYESSVGKKQT
jgi:predicted nucleic acid-binding protein